ncbi:hypothetical protein BEYONPHE_300 [Bacillus phage Beyonphe]|nr:hypothetical protein BEYONPHE_3 [Bacillus phage Beyonphe]QDH49987.1 hypothetical protein BEYONPHE_300 [Bacillus phage Beyonphe]
MYITSDVYVIDKPVKLYNGNWRFTVHTFDGLLVREHTCATKTIAMKRRTQERRTRMSEGAKVIYI